MRAALQEASSGTIHLLGEFALIGRGDGASVRLSDQSISRQHATIRFEAGFYRVFDIGSANGTYVNGAALTGSRVLREGDRLQFGAVEFTFRLQETPPAVEYPAAFERTEIAQLAPAPVRSTPVILMVADLKGFTRLSSRLQPGDVADLLREWYADCTSILHTNGATIDKFIGDCFFAYWYDTETDTRSRVLEAARAIRALEEDPQTPARIRLRRQLDVRLDCRLGLHAGNVAVGAMGTGINTALGDAVNIAFRIEALTRQLDRIVLSSAAFLDNWPEGAAMCTPCGAHLLRGQDTPTEIYSFDLA